MTGRTLILSSLPPGLYTLEVQGRRYRQQWSASVEARFDITPPYWQTPWFRLLLLVGVGALILGVHQWRLHWMEVRARWLSAAVDERTATLRQVQTQLETQNLQLVQANRMKDTFLNNMGHEIRTPLAGILGCSELLLEMVQGPEREFVQAIEHSGQRLFDTLDTMFELAQLEGGRAEWHEEELDVLAIAEETAAAFKARAAEKGLSLRILSPQAPVTARLERRGLRRVFKTLIGNAVKFTAQGGVTVALAADETYVQVQVQDTGTGISPAFLPHLFEAFMQESEGMGRRFEGSGLGLALMKGIVDRMGGQISVESMKGAGSTFTVRLPRTSTEATSDGIADDRPLVQVAAGTPPDVKRLHPAPPGR